MYTLTLAPPRRQDGQPLYILVKMVTDRGIIFSLLNPAMCQAFYFARVVLLSAYTKPVELGAVSISIFT